MADLVEQIENDFLSAIGNLGAKSRTNDSSSDTLLDLAILISLYYLELDLICRVNTDLRPQRRMAREND